MRYSLAASSTALSVICLMLCCAPTLAAEQAYAPFAQEQLSRLPANGRLLFDGGDLARFSVSGSKEQATHKVVPIADQPFGNALQINVLKATEPAYAVQLITPGNTIPVVKGETVLVSFSIRCLSSADPSGTGTYNGQLQLTSAPWTSVVSLNNNASPQWQRIYACGIAPRDYAPGQLSLAIHLGHHAQLMELGGFVLVNLGKNVDVAKLPYTPITYAGREANAPWRQAAGQRIEQYRKGDLTITVIDAAGKPIPAAQVHVQMTRHAYGFGTFMEEPILRQTPDGEKYRQWAKKLFNRGTTPIYWADWGWANPARRKVYHGIATWLKENHFPTRGHVIVYPGWQFMPQEARKLRDNPAALRQRILDHVAEVVQATNQYNFDEYDVTNELRDLRDLTDILGYQAVIEWYQTARKYNPTARLALNENTIVENGGKTQAQQDHFAKMIQLLLDAKVGPDAIGIQGHFGEALTPPDKIVTILDRFAQYGKPIHITEFDIITRDFDAQGDYMRDFMTAIFSHPATEAFTQWGFWEGCHWKPLGAMIRKDWTLKPNGQAYMDLVFKQWWTDTQGPTAANGTFATRGFRGDYQITVTVGGRSKTAVVTLPQEGVKLNIAME